MSLLLSALFALPWGELFALAPPAAPSAPDPQSYREAALGVQGALKEAGFKTDSVQLQSKAGHLYLALQMNPEGWKQSMRSKCNRKLAITLWAYGFRHSEDDNASSPYLLSKEVVSPDDLAEVRRFSDGMKEGAAECRAEAAAHKSADEKSPIALQEPPESPAAPQAAEPKDESFAALAARSSHWPLSKRLIPVSYTMAWGSPRDYFESVNNLEKMLRAMANRRRLNGKRGPKARESVAKLAEAARAKNGEARASSAQGPQPSAPGDPSQGPAHRHSGDSRPHLHLASNPAYAVAGGGSDPPSGGPSSKASASSSGGDNSDPAARARRRAQFEKMRLALLLAMMEANGQQPQHPPHRHCRKVGSTLVCTPIPGE